jgi:outer membrane biogenesis lipoprotein LolB
MLRLTVLLTLLPCAALAGEQWSWVKVANTVNAWETSQGKAEVSIDGEKFEARLLWDDNPRDARITLSGTIRNGKVVVKELVHNSDYSGSTYTGTYESKRWEGFADGAGGEVVTLSDGWGMIGLTRRIPK